MKKLALAIGFAAYVVFGASSGSLAASKIDNGAGVATNRDSPIGSETATNARLLFVNQTFYPDTTSTVDAVLAHRIGERSAVAATATNTRLLFVNEAFYPDTTATVDAVLAHRIGERSALAATDDAVLAHRKGERADVAQPNTSRSDTERMICDGDICLVP